MTVRKNNRQKRTRSRRSLILLQPGTLVKENPGGGGTPLYKLYRCVPPRLVGFLRRFGLKTGTHFAHFGLESGVDFEGTTGVYERINLFNSK